MRAMRVALKPMVLSIVDLASPSIPPPAWLFGAQRPFTYHEKLNVADCFRSR